MGSWCKPSAAPATVTGLDRKPGDRLNGQTPDPRREDVCVRPQLWVAQTPSLDGACLLPFLFISLAPVAMASDDAPDAELVVEEDRSRTVKASETSAAVTVIPLDGSLPVSAEVADALETAAGIRIQRLGGMGSLSTVSIRGSTSRQVRMLNLYC